MDTPVMQWAKRPESGIRCVTLVDHDHADQDDEATQPIPDFARLLAASISNEIEDDHRVSELPVPVPRPASTWTKLSIAAGVVNCACATAFIVATISAHAASTATHAARAASFVDVHRASFASVAAIVLPLRPIAKPVAAGSPHPPPPKSRHSRGADIIRRCPY